MKPFACLAACCLLVAACGQESPPPADDAVPGPLSSPVAAASPQPERFRYTSLDGCSLTRSAPEEAGFFEHECQGEGGYRLTHVASDLRENLVVIAPVGGEHDLELTALAGGAFNSIGNTVEWRGKPGRGPFAPQSLIVRQTVMEDPDTAVPESSYLIVARLQPTPCVVARVKPGPDQNRRARRLADTAGTCLATSG